MRLFLVTSHHTKTMEPTQTCISLTDAESEHEAVGLHVAHYVKLYPDHKMDMPEAKDISDRAREFVKENPK